MTSKRVVNSYADFHALEGQQIVDSEPMEISVQGIQDFCRGTHNDEWIHWDQERCKASPLGDLIAPGLYLPALYPSVFWNQMEINIPRIIVKGINDIRIYQPVTVGTQIVIRATVAKVMDRDRGIEVHYAVTFIIADTDETVGKATFINRYWGLEDQ